MRKRNIIVGIIIVLVLLVFGGYKIATTPRHTLEKQSITISKKAAHLTRTTDFMIYNREQTYYAVAGYTQDNQLKYVVINGKSGKITVLETNKAYTKDKITKLVAKKYPSNKIYGIDLGLNKGQPVWEVATKSKTGQLTYRLFDYQTGKLVEQIENL